MSSLRAGTTAVLASRSDAVETARIPLTGAVTGTTYDRFGRPVGAVAGTAVRVPAQGFVVAWRD